MVNLIKYILDYVLRSFHIGSLLPNCNRLFMSILKTSTIAFGACIYIFILLCAPYHILMAYCLMMINRLSICHWDASLLSQPPNPQPYP